MTMETGGDLSPPSSPFHGFQPGAARTAATDSPVEETPFYGFSNADIPRPILIKTEPGTEDEDDVVIVEVRKAAKPVELLIKKEILDDEEDGEEDAFYGFSLADIPRPIIIKEEPKELSVHRADAAPFPQHLFLEPDESIATDASKQQQSDSSAAVSSAAYSPIKSPFRPISPDRSGPSPAKRIGTSSAAFVDTSSEETTKSPTTAIGSLTVAPETLFQKPAAATASDPNKSDVPVPVSSLETDVSDITERLPVSEKDASDFPPVDDSCAVQPQDSAAASSLSSVDGGGPTSTSESKDTQIESTVVTGTAAADITDENDAAAIPPQESSVPVPVTTVAAVVDNSVTTFSSVEDVVSSQLPSLGEEGSSAATAPVVQEKSSIVATAAAAAGLIVDGSEEQIMVGDQHTFVAVDEMVTGQEKQIEVVGEDTAEGDGQQEPIMIIVDSQGASIDEEEEMVVEQEQPQQQEETIQIINVGEAAESTFVSIKPKSEQMPPSPGRIIQARLSQSRIVNKYTAPSSQITIFETMADVMEGGGMKHEIEPTTTTTTTTRLPRNIQILDENGENIVLMTNGDDSEDSDDEEEDREFTVIVEDDMGSEEEMELEQQDGHQKTTRIEAESIEDILAQFEAEPTATKTVSCPNCRKCFVSQHFLNMHISNSSTMCELCNTQCCTAVNLRNHRNLECDLAKRKRNIDLIAQETALLGRKPIEPEKYYNVPIESSDEESEPVVRKPVKSVNDQKYECSVCFQYVKILDSHMKFIHGLDAARGSKYKCQDCGVLVSDMTKHRNLRHDPASKIVIADQEPDVVRCKNPNCDMFFNNPDEAAEHNKREHSDEVRLACGMGNCGMVFDNRGSLRKHRSDAHPELDEFRPVDLEPDDPDRDIDFTVACPVCEKKFKHKNTCTVHIKVHHLGWSKRKLFECPDCYKSFENKKAMDMHRESIHLGIRTVCPLCDKPVTRLDLHVRMVHTELPEWPCPDCGKKFKRKFDLNRHRVTVHLGVRNFPCDLCGKRFADMKDMTRHKNAVHYGMKIKWNSRRHKEERMRRKEMGERSIKYKSQKRDERRAGRRGVPVEFMETVETSGGGSGHQMVHIEEAPGGAVILDPMLQSQLAAVQGTAGDARVLIEADPDSSGGLRFVVIQDESGLVEDDDDDDDDEENGLEEDDDQEDEEEEEEYDESELVVEHDVEC